MKPMYTRSQDGKGLFVYNDAGYSVPPPSAMAAWPPTKKMRKLEAKYVDLQLFAIKQFIKTLPPPDEHLDEPLVPDSWYLYTENGRHYGRYRTVTGVFDGALLEQAMAAVDASDLPDDIKERVLARAHSIAIQHGMSISYAGLRAALRRRW